ncbi:MAG: aminotransferase class I/II-fold pyridoxal phosphate-dependent enzyme, partial [Clostridia bacterium]
MENNSAIRTMFEEGDKKREEYGPENVYDFSLGNPDAPVPAEVKQSIIDSSVNEEDLTVLHGYMSNAGFEDVRETIAQSLNRRFGTAFDHGNILMTPGAASGLNVALKKTIPNPGEEVIIFAPYFLEYNWYVNNYDGKVVQAPTDQETFY